MRRFGTHVRAVHCVEGVMRKTIFAAILLSAAGVAMAQVATRSDPTDSKAAVPSATYRSAFEDYRGFVDQPVSGWRAVNDEVGRLNGHIGHVRTPTAPAAKPPSKPEARGGHRGHK